MSNESEESMLLERAFLRIGSAQSDEQFESLIEKLLGPVIFKVPSPHESVRKKAIELLTHISKRVKCRPAVQVPVKLLLELYLQATKDQFVKNFLAVYIKLGYHRMVSEKQIECIPLLINCIEESKTTEQLKNSFLSLFIRSCKHFMNEDTAKRFLISNNLKEWKNMNLLLEVFYDVLLTPYSWDEYLNANSVPPGMSSCTFKRITQDGKIEDFYQVKLGILNLLTAGNLQMETTFIHFVLASLDTNTDVLALGKQHMKNVHGTFEWTEETLRPLYTLFVGDNEKILESKRRHPADLRMKIILLPYLYRLNTYCWPECIQVVVSCLKEESNAKIKTSGLNFGLSALQKAELHSFKEVAPNFLNMLTEILWKREMDDNVRMLIYRLAGNVIALNPELVKHYKEIFPKFIEDLTEETLPEVKNTIKESLIKMANSFRQTEEPEALMHFLANRITSPVSCVKQVVLHYLHKVFPCNHVKSRFLLAWSSADTDPAIRSLAEQLLLSDLKSKSNRGSESIELPVPDFSKMILFVYKGSVEDNKLKDKFEFGDQKLTLTDSAYIQVLLYIRNCMLYNCYSPLCTMKFEHPCVHSPRIGSYLASLFTNDSLAMEHYIDFISLITCQTAHIEALRCLLECVGTVPEHLAAKLIEKPAVLQKMLKHSNDEVNYLASTLHGMVLCCGGVTIEEIKNKFQEFKNVLESKVSDYMSLLMVLWSTASFSEKGGFKKIGGVPPFIVEAIVELSSHTSPNVAAAACYCLGQIGRRNDLPFPNRNLNDPVKYADFNGSPEEGEDGLNLKDTEKQPSSSLTKLKILEKLLDLMVNKSSPYKVKMKAAKAVGLFCVGEENFPFRKLIINAIIEKENEVKEIGQLMDIGSVLSDCVMGPYSVQVLDLWIQKEADYKMPECWNSKRSKEMFLFAYSKIANGLVSVEKSKSKTAAAAWLLVLMGSCLNVPLDLNELSKIQYTFLELMVLNDDVIHEVATRGLSFIPRFTSTENASVLAKQLTDNISLIQKKTTELGSVLAMYKEFSYLVSSLKNHALIYHFLNLVHHQNQNADEKYSSAFKDHEDISISELVPYYPQMIPSLFVYRFHPSPKIKQAMNVIWSTLFPESVKTIQAHSKIILQKSVPELVCPVSDLRIAYCFALEELLRIEGNKFVWDNKELMPDLLGNLYKLMDDIYETVRRTAYGTTKMYLQAFVQNVVRFKGQRDEEKAFLSGILPVLLNVGVPSTVKEIRNISVQKLLEIIDHLGPLIKSHLPTLIPSMIENASEVEMDIRYVEQKLGIELPDSTNDVIMSGHFSSEIVKKCMNYIDEEVLKELFPRLLELLKENISFITRSAAINFVVLLSKSMEAQKLQPFVGKLLGALFSGLSNNHKNIRKNSASAIGSLSKLAKDTSIDNLLTKLVQLYMKNIQDENIKSAVGQCFLAVGSQCQEAVQARSEKIVPVIFFAMHLKKTVDGTNDQFIDLWNEVWNDVIGSMEVALSKHRIAILEFLRQSFGSPSWNVKTQAARSLSTFVSKCPDDLTDCEELKLLTQDIINTVSGKFWHGKEEVVETAATLCSNKRAVGELLHIQILEAVLKECGRGNISYQAVAMETLGKILTSNEYRLNYFIDIYDKLKAIITADDDDTTNSEYMDLEESSAAMNQRMKLKETAYFVLGKAWPDNVETQKQFQQEVLSMLTACLFKSTRLTQVSIMVALKNLLSKLHIIRKIRFTPDEEATLDSIMQNVEKSLSYAVEMKKHTLLKKEALHVMINLIEIFHEYNNTTCVKRIQKLYLDHINELMKDTDPIIVLQTSQLKDLLRRTT